jgi:hypothetical protein
VIAIVTIAPRPLPYRTAATVCANNSPSQKLLGREIWELAFMRDRAMSFEKFSDSSNFVASFSHPPAKSLAVFARGYARAANRLSEGLLGAPKFADYDAYPVVFLYRHALELSLKHVIYAGGSWRHSADSMSFMLS